MYDIIIIGGGIAGVYATYKIHKKNPAVKVLLIEKENQLGGRVHTFTNNHMTVEAGAGRINGSHPLTMDLIRELGLSKKLRKIEGSVVFRPANFQGAIESSVSDAPQQDPHPLTTAPSLSTKTLNNIIDITLGPKTLPNASLILYLVMVSKTYSKQYLQNHTLTQFAERVLTKEQVEFIKRSFGYYSELVLMNAYDAIKLLNALGPSNTFYGMRDGLEQIIDKMVDAIKKNPNITVFLRKEVSKIIYRGSSSGSHLEPDKCLEVFIGTQKYECRTCICAVPKNTLKKWSIFKDVRPLLDKVECGTLCRIYSQFDKDPATGKVWFDGFDKFTTDNDLRMVIPYSTKSGTIMISYSDNIFADRWQRLYEKHGIRAVNTKLREDMLESTGKWIPLPKHTQVFYWDCGVGYWGVGADSRLIAKKMIQPFSSIPLFVCGENYSENGQQWMEGALETADKALQIIIMPH
jgi:monoamine oxidase